MQTKPWPHESDSPNVMVLGGARNDAATVIAFVAGVVGMMDQWTS